MPDKPDVIPTLVFIVGLDGSVPRWFLYDMLHRVLHGRDYNALALLAPEYRQLRETISRWYDDVNDYLICMGRTGLPGISGFRDGDGI